jgi:very-short-patch-repair endonuclease
MDPDLTIARLAARRHGLISRDDALAAGLSSSALRRRVAAGRLERVAPGVLRVPGSPRTWRQRVLAGVLASGPSAAASHLTAAHLLGLEGCPRPVGRPHVSVVRPARGAAGPARIHRTGRRSPGDLGLVDAIPTTGVERTLLDLAADAPPSLVEAAVDGALRDGLTSMARLRGRIESDGGRGVAGSALLRSLLGLGVRPESWLERQALRVLRAAGLPDPELQREVTDADGLIGRVDLAYAGGRVIVELAGHRTHATRRQRQTDHERANRLALEGVVVLQFTYEDVVERPAHVVALVRRAIATAAA